MRWRALVLVLVGSGCVSVSPSRAIHWKTLVTSHSPADALAYFSQPTASPDVCDARVANDLLVANDVAEGLLEGFVAGVIAPDVMGECLRRALLTLDRGDGEVLLNRLVLSLERLLRHDHLEHEASIALRLAVLRDVLLERPAGLNPSERIRRPRIEWLERAVGERALSGRARSVGLSILEAEAMERGVYEGESVDAVRLGTLEVERQRVVLERMVRRLPSKELRREAARRLISLNISESAHVELAPQRDAVIDLVLRYGANAVELTAARIERRWLEPEPAPGVVVSQPDEEGVLPLTVGTGRAPPAQVGLQGVVQVKLKDLARPVTVCGDLDPFDPTPCLSPAAVTVEAPFLEAMGHGRYQFVETPEKRLGLELVSRPSLDAVVFVAGAEAGRLSWDTTFAEPENVVLSGDEGERGPDLRVRIDWYVAVQRGLVEVSWREGVERRVVEAGRIPAFLVVSRGGVGLRGGSGRDGDAGRDGDRCEDGGAGGDGGDGGRGGEGGRGGDVDVELRCVGAPCPDGVKAELLTVFRTEGGDGGPGGAGGEGGPGGAGGRGRTDGCRPGGTGLAGQQGSQGPRGLRGSPGTVRFTDRARL
jgi:hypothetical protein